MADFHDPQVWRELLTQFQEGSAEFGKAPIYLEGLTSATRFKLDKARSNCLQDYLGFVSWFVECAGRTEERNFYVYASIDFISGVFDEETHTFSLEALKCFCPLAERAGAHLPSSVRNAIPGKRRDAGSMWCSLLWWFNAEHCFDSSAILDTTNLVSSCPFEDSINVIEKCGLTGDSPSFPFSVSFANDKVIVEADKAQKTPAEVEAAGSGNGSTTPPGGARLKIVAALTKHYEYATDSCMNTAPIGVNALARMVGVSSGSVSNFFEKNFGGHTKYKVFCRTPASLVAMIKAINAGFSRL